MAGTLYLVATPIGNLADITFRAVEVLRSVDLIACEDTRQTRKLLDRYAIAKPTLSYHEHNEELRAPELARRLQDGESVALVSDAGTPLVSDPGYRLVRSALESGVRVIPIPGPAAVLSALCASGLPPIPFRFEGFLPRKQTERRDLLAGLRDDPATLVFYEAPHRILESLREIAAWLDDPPVAVAREITKLHEEFLRGTASQVLDVLERRDSVRGEITLLVGPRPARKSVEPLAQTVERLQAAGLPRMEAIKAAAREHGLPKREAYRLLESGS
jgi:16S rRNA (cytidine1402-2'-O)-methyltransferase